MTAALTIEKDMKSIHAKKIPAASRGRLIGEAFSFSDVFMSINDSVRHFLVLYRLLFGCL
jgi:hypothetical protein